MCVAPRRLGASSSWAASWADHNASANAWSTKGGSCPEAMSAAEMTVRSALSTLSEDRPKRLATQQTANLEKLNSPATQGRPPGAEEFQFSVVFPELRAISTMATVPTVVPRH